MRHRVYMPATIIVARGLLSPMQWCGQHFSAPGQRVKENVKIKKLSFFGWHFLIIIEDEIAVVV